MATPDTIWSTRKVTVATAWMRATSVPASTATSRPAAAPKRSAPQAPNQVPKIIIPSMPMLTTPERSLNTPPMVARNSGTNARTVAAITAKPMSCPTISGTLVRLLQLPAGGGPAHQLVGHHDGEDDDALQDNRDLLGHVGVEPDPRAGPVQVGEQQRPGHDAEARVAAEQGDGDGGEAVAADVVELHVAVDAEHVLQPDHPGHRSGQQHRLEHHGVGADAGRLGGAQVGAEHAQLEAEAGAPHHEGVDHRADDGEQEEPGDRRRCAEVEADRVEERHHAADLGGLVDRDGALLGDGADLGGVLQL